MNRIPSYLRPRLWTRADGLHCCGVPGKRYESASTAQLAYALWLSKRPGHARDRIVMACPGAGRAIAELVRVRGLR